MALEDYEKARKLGEKSYRQDVIKGRYPYLPALYEILKGPAARREEKIGLMEIPIRLICGTLTKGRQEAFAKNYMPLLAPNSEFAMKWINLFAHQANEGIRDPINAYEFLGRFYIAEGNKRVSVMKYIGQPDILADIIRIIPDDSNTSEEVVIYREFMKFFACTSIYGIYFTTEGNYQRLADIYGQDLASAWPEDVRKQLKSEFYTFARLYSEHTGNHSVLFYGDVFMIYIKLYQHSSLLEDSDAVIRDNLEHIWPSHKSFLQKLKALYDML